MKMVFYPLKANPKYGDWKIEDACCEQFARGWLDGYIGPLLKEGWQERDKGIPSIYKYKEAPGGVEYRALPIDFCPFCGKSLDVVYEEAG